jgi:hypothetical protein
VGRLRQMLDRLRQTDEDRLADETRAWAETVPQTQRIGDCPVRERVRIAGAVRRLTVRPVEGFESLEAVISDGTGEVTAQWMGRSQIPGLRLGTRLILEGVMGRNEPLKIVNPQFEFA